MGRLRLLSVLFALLSAHALTACGARGALREPTFTDAAPGDVFDAAPDVVAPPDVVALPDVITPPDVVSQLSLAIPMCLLYEVGIWAAQLFIRHTKAPEAEGGESAST